MLNLYDILIEYETSELWSHSQARPALVPSLRCVERAWERGYIDKLYNMKQL